MPDGDYELGGLPIKLGGGVARRVSVGEFIRSGRWLAAGGTVAVHLALAGLALFWLVPVSVMPAQSSRISAAIRHCAARLILMMWASQPFICCLTCRAV